MYLCKVKAMKQRRKINVMNKNSKMKFDWNGKEVHLTFTQRKTKFEKETAIQSIKSLFSQGESHGDNVLDRWNGKEAQVSDHKPGSRGKQTYVKIDVES